MPGNNSRSTAVFRKLIRNPRCWFASGLLILAVPAWAGDKPAAVAVTGAGAVMPAIAGPAVTAASDGGLQAGIDERVVQSMTKSGYDKEQVREEVGKGCDGTGGDMAISAAYSYDSLNGKTVTVAEGGGTSYCLNLSSGARAGDTITLSFSGASGCKVILGDITVDANGAVITLVEGQTQARFSLVHEGDLDADATASLSATYNSNGTSATSNTWGVNLRDSGEAENTFNGDFVVVTEKNTGVPITRINTLGVTVAVVETDEPYCVTDAQGNLKAGTTEPTQRPIYGEHGEVIGMETIPSNDQMVTDNTIFGTGGNDKLNGLAGNDLLTAGLGINRLDAANQGAFICAA